VLSSPCFPPQMRRSYPFPMGGFHTLEWSTFIFMSVPQLSGGPGGRGPLPSSTLDASSAESPIWPYVNTTDENGALVRVWSEGSARERISDDAGVPRGVAQKSQRARAPQRGTTAAAV
jgi:hypothetical protein